MTKNKKIHLQMTTHDSNVFNFIHALISQLALISITNLHSQHLLITVIFPPPFYFNY